MTSQTPGRLAATLKRALIAVDDEDKIVPVTSSVPRISRTDTEPLKPAPRMEATGVPPEPVFGTMESILGGGPATVWNPARIEAPLSALATRRSQVFGGRLPVWNEAVILLGAYELTDPRIKSSGRCRRTDGGPQKPPPWITTVKNGWTPALGTIESMCGVLRTVVYPPNNVSAPPSAFDTRTSHVPTTLAGVNVKPTSILAAPSFDNTSPVTEAPGRSRITEVGKLKLAPWITTQSCGPTPVPGTMESMRGG